jgi:hypothetical protein
MREGGQQPPSRAFRIVENAELPKDRRAIVIDRFYR